MNVLYQFNEKYAPYAGVSITSLFENNKNADEICVLYEGEIVERGTHEELIALNGYYKKLNDMQSL
jgi:subfamily B ATP-binding cassette protein MsbA